MNRTTTLGPAIALAVLLVACSPQAQAPTDAGATRTQPSAETHADPTLAGPTRAPEPTPAPRATASVFFAVHIETRDHATHSNSVAGDWPMLAALVELADRHGHKLTLEFQPQWAEYALREPDRLAEVRSWEAAGHEIAVHHHGVSHPAWDGYTNAPGFAAHPGYRGTMDDAMAALSALPGSGSLRTGGMTDETTDWPSGLIYATGGSGMRGAALVSTPTRTVYRGVQATQVAYTGYQLGQGPTASLADIEAALGSSREGQVIGLVAHPYDFWDNRAEFEALFAMLDDHGLQLQTVSHILDPD